MLVNPRLCRQACALHLKHSAGNAWDWAHRAAVRPVTIAKRTSRCVRTARHSHGVPGAAKLASGMHPLRIQLELLALCGRCRADRLGHIPLPRAHTHATPNKVAIARFTHDRAGIITIS